MLLKDGSALGMERHYCYFKDSKNADLKRILGNGFLKRGKEGVLFLEEKLKTETDALAKEILPTTAGRPHQPLLNERYGCRR